MLDGCVAVAVGAGLVGLAGLALPQRLAVEHPQHAGIGGVVVLHGAGLAAHELVAGLALGQRDVGEGGGGEQARTAMLMIATALITICRFRRALAQMHLARPIERPFGSHCERGWIDSTVMVALRSRKAVVAGPLEFDLAAFGRDRRERDERIGGDRRIEDRRGRSPRRCRSRRTSVMMSRGTSLPTLSGR